MAGEVSTNGRTGITGSRRNPWMRATILPHSYYVRYFTYAPLIFRGQEEKRWRRGQIKKV
jgi:hypothetical protein